MVLYQHRSFRISIDTKEDTTLSDFTHTFTDIRIAAPQQTYKSNGVWEHACSFERFEQLEAWYAGQRRIFAFKIL